MKSRIATALVAAVALVATATIARAADSKPRIAVLEFKNKADNQWWWHGGAAAAQDVFVTELVKSGKFRVVEREQLAALMQEKNLALSGDVDPSTATQAGRLFGVRYLLTGSVTEYGATETGAHGAFGGFRLGRHQVGILIRRQSQKNDHDQNSDQNDAGPLRPSHSALRGPRSALRHGPPPVVDEPVASVVAAGNALAEPMATTCR